MSDLKKDKQQDEKTCPLCHGHKSIPGTCTCDNEWRGTQQGSEWKDCQCTPDQACPTCNGTGTVTD